MCKIVEAATGASKSTQVQIGTQKIGDAIPSSLFETTKEKRKRVIGSDDFNMTVVRRIGNNFYLVKNT